ncbi:MAG: MurR/RpiR family transcriptional regulator [candidate division KSB1 bacterium]|nr:MurR/RpiR family transcriptional regulator [candidate division KSB1 bacterium]MDZ7274638.1 MurR/RpiR family transcriptional regulator [candidate division KSB1 bacterium]MDZ7285463.1 MurR/RpiR family transcriptional regulator [candidate division KSB1 bacterium]MDZ7298495.1 MurR/RpiR family transcriptional regulator [candidate division KSB1 bacterium]MDZ7306281.1 MurR/RpiR family transcriptional regulator [candidate division KSB1 bacterium]
MPSRKPQNAPVLTQKILALYQRLPANQRKVADYFLQQPNDFSFLTTDAMAEALHVSKATIVRFAQKLGYDGFPALRNEVLQTLQANLAPADRFMLAFAKHSPEEALTLVAGHEVQNINQTLLHLDRQVFHEVVQMLRGAARVYTMGLGISKLLAQLLAYELHQVAIDARPLASGTMRFVEQLVLAKKEDVVVAFSFPPYSRETVAAATYAAEKGLALVAITDKPAAPVTFHATRVLAVRTKNMLYTNSISAISVVINALVTEIALHNKQEVSRVFQESSRIMQQTQEFLDD